MKAKILKVLESQMDGFICPNQTDFRDVDVREFFGAIGSLIDEGILQKRNCEGLAFEIVPTLEAKLKAAEICKASPIGKEKVADIKVER